MEEADLPNMSETTTSRATLLFVSQLRCEMEVKMDIKNKRIIIAAGIILLIAGMTIAIVENTSFFIPYGKVIESKEKNIEVNSTITFNDLEFPNQRDGLSLFMYRTNEVTIINNKDIYFYADIGIPHNKEFRPLETTGRNCGESHIFKLDGENYKSIYDLKDTKKIIRGMASNGKDRLFFIINDTSDNIDQRNTLACIDLNGNLIWQEKYADMIVGLKWCDDKLLVETTDYKNLDTPFSKYYYADKNKLSIYTFDGKMIGEQNLDGWIIDAKCNNGCLFLNIARRNGEDTHFYSLVCIDKKEKIIWQKSINKSGFAIFNDEAGVVICELTKDGQCTKFDSNGDARKLSKFNLQNVLTKDMIPLEIDDYQNNKFLNGLFKFEIKYSDNFDKLNVLSYKTIPEFEFGYYHKTLYLGKELLSYGTTDTEAAAVEFVFIGEDDYVQ